MSAVQGKNCVRLFSATNKSSRIHKNLIGFLNRGCYTYKIKSAIHLRTERERGLRSLLLFSGTAVLQMLTRNVSESSNQEK